MLRYIKFPDGTIRHAIIADEEFGDLSMLVRMRRDLYWFLELILTNRDIVEETTHVGEYISDFLQLLRWMELEPRDKYEDDKEAQRNALNISNATPMMGKFTHIDYIEVEAEGVDKGTQLRERVEEAQRKLRAYEF